MQSYRLRLFLALAVGTAIGWPTTSALAAPCVESTQTWKWTGLQKFNKAKYSENLSGLACAPVSDTARTCVVVQDEDFQAAIAIITPGHLDIRTTFSLPNGTKHEEFDAEAAAFDARMFYVLGSHSRRAKRCLTENPSSRQLVRFTQDSAAAGPPAIQSSGDKLSKLITSLPGISDKFDKCLGTVRPADAEGEWKPEQGVNIEGLAVVDKKVFLGLRGPVLAGAAQIITTNLDYLFGSAAPQGTVVALQLSPVGGVRDLAAYNGKILILSGSEDDTIGGAAIHLWDGVGGKPRKLCDIPSPAANSKDKPEALVVLSGAAELPLRVLVLSDGPPEGNPREFVVTVD